MPHPSPSCPKCSNAFARSRASATAKRASISRLSDSHRRLRRASHARPLLAGAESAAEQILRVLEIGDEIDLATEFAPLVNQLVQEAQCRVVFQREAHRVENGDFLGR